MYSLFFLGISSVILALVLTPLVRNLAWRFGIVDQPDQRRKIHRTPVPRLGGVAIFASVLGAFGLLLVARLSAGAIVWEGLPLVVRLLPAFAIVFGIGLLDDIVSVRPWIKLAAEVIAGIMVWFGGIHVSGFVGYSFSSTAASFGLTLLWIVLCTNAINLIDGVDGLATGVSLFAASTMLFAAIFAHNVPMALAIVPLAGALLGFLRYNFNPASIFLGDCGSLPLGFLLACYGAVWSEKSTTLLGMTAPLLVLAVPLFDVALAIARRLINGKPIFAADRSHFHHKLLSKGLTPRRLVLIVYGVCGMGALASLLLTMNGNRNRDFLMVIVCLAAWLGLQQLGYNEFSVAGRVVFGGVFRSVLSAQLALETFEQELKRDITLEQSWEILCRACPQFGFSGIDFHLGDLQRRWGSSEGWQVRLDFLGYGYIYLWLEPGAKSRGAAAVLFMDCVSRTFNHKLNELQTTLSE
jgi:UDP-GlcNAc:undecaprenyl-phosphate GlcNAc-1-phosphate transferase